MVGNQITLTGTLNFDETKMNDVSARVGGRIEKLFGFFGSLKRGEGEFRVATAANECSSIVKSTPRL